MFAQFWGAYPKRAGGNPQSDARKAFLARVKEGVDPHLLVDKVNAYRKFCEATGKTGTEWVKQARFWLGPKCEGWKESWAPPIDLAREPMSELGHDLSDVEY